MVVTDKTKFAGKPQFICLVNGRSSSGSNVVYSQYLKPCASNFACFQVCLFVLNVQSIHLKYGKKVNNEHS